MKRNFLILFLLTGLSSFAQTFPETWIGNWKGEMQWFSTGAPTPQKVQMQLRIQKGDSAGTFTWHLIYGAADEDSRPYILKEINKAKGHWVIDELNGIVLDQYRVADKLAGAFTVGNSTIINNYWLENGKMHVEFYSISARPVATTGSGTEESPEVQSYQVGSYQKAVLSNIQ